MRSQGKGAQGVTILKKSFPFFLVPLPQLRDDFICLTLGCILCRTQAVNTRLVGALCHWDSSEGSACSAPHEGLRRGSRIFERGGVWVINWQCAHRRCAPLWGLKACPLGTFEILDAIWCIFFFGPIFLFFYLYSVDERGRAPPTPPWIRAWVWSCWVCTAADRLSHEAAN